MTEWHFMLCSECPRPGWHTLASLPSFPGATCMCLINTLCTLCHPLSVRAETTVHPQEPAPAFIRDRCFPNTQFSALWMRAPVCQHSEYTFSYCSVCKASNKICLYVRQGCVSGTTGSGGGCPEAWFLPQCFLWWRRERSVREVTLSQNKATPFWDVWVGFSVTTHLT